MGGDRHSGVWRLSVLDSSWADWSRLSESLCRTRIPRQAETFQQRPLGQTWQDWSPPLTSPRSPPANHPPTFVAGSLSHHLPAWSKMTDNGCIFTGVEVGVLAPMVFPLGSSCVLWGKGGRSISGPSFSASFCLRGFSPTIPETWLSIYALEASVSGHTSMTGLSWQTAALSAVSTFRKFSVCHPV